VESAPGTLTPCPLSQTIPQRGMDPLPEPSPPAPSPMTNHTGEGGGTDESLCSSPPPGTPGSAFPSGGWHPRLCSYRPSGDTLNDSIY